MSVWTFWQTTHARARTYIHERECARTCVRTQDIAATRRERERTSSPLRAAGLGPERERERERDTRKNTHTHASTHSLPQAGRPPSMQQERVESNKGLSSHNTHTDIHTLTHTATDSLTHYRATHTHTNAQTQHTCTHTFATE